MSRLYEDELSNALIHDVQYRHEALEGYIYGVHPGYRRFTWNLWSILNTIPVQSELSPWSHDTEPPSLLVRGLSPLTPEHAQVGIDQDLSRVSIAYIVPRSSNVTAFARRRIAMHFAPPTRKVRDVAGLVSLKSRRPALIGGPMRPRRGSSRTSSPRIACREDLRGARLHTRCMWHVGQVQRRRARTRWVQWARCMCMRR